MKNGVISLSKLVSQVFSPSIVIISFVALLVFQNHNLFPLLILCSILWIHLLIRKNLADEQIYVKRATQYILAIVVLLGLFWLHFIPEEYKSIVVLIIINTVIFMVVTFIFKYKLSAHTLYGYFFFCISSILMGDYKVGLIILYLIIFSRIILKQHTPSQILISLTIITSSTFIMTYV